MHAQLREFLSDNGPADRLDWKLCERSRQPEYLRRVLEAQPWRPTFWKEARNHLSYRRFFEVTGLVGVRVELEDVFADVHRLIFELVKKGMVDGLRIDHVDGLADPTAYLTQLRRAFGPETPIFVEKILGPEERLPPAWDICGTTGYEFIAALADGLVDVEGVAELHRIYDGVTQRTGDPAGDIAAVKERIASHNFAGEVDRLAGLAATRAVQPHREP